LSLSSQKIASDSLYRKAIGGALCRLGIFFPYKGFLYTISLVITRAAANSPFFNESDFLSFRLVKNGDASGVGVPLFSISLERLYLYK
jgi:hypothetical protein